MIILGIDPGYQRVGIAVLTSEKGVKEKLLFSSCFETEKINPGKRLELIGSEIEKIINTYQPEVLAIEKLFWGKNKKTALKVAEARGVIVHTATKCGLVVIEYSPADIKISVTGHGASKKDQVIKMVQLLINIPPRKERILDDEYDAIAIALTHSSSRHFPQ